jgi:hypothetical protein
MHALAVALVKQNALLIAFLKGITDLLLMKPYVSNVELVQVFVQWMHHSSSRNWILEPRAWILDCVFLQGITPILGSSL